MGLSDSLSPRSRSGSVSGGRGADLDAGAPVPRDLQHIAVDPRKLSILDRRLRGHGEGRVLESSCTPPRSTVAAVTSVTPVPPPRGDGRRPGAPGRATDGFGGGRALEARFGKDDGSDGASNASCQTVQHANFPPGTAAPAAATKAPAPPSAKKKRTPSKRPVSAIGDRYATPTLRSKPNGAGEAVAAVGGGASGSAGGGLKKSRTRKAEEAKAAHEATGQLDPTTVESSTDGLPPPHGGVSPLKQPGGGADQTSRTSESRDTLYSYFGASNSAAAATTPHSNPPAAPSRTPALASPPALQSKAGAPRDKPGNQRTLHSFLGIAVDRGERKPPGHEEEGSKRGDGRGGGAPKEGGNGSTPVAAPSVPASLGASSAKPAAESTRNKKKKAALKPRGGAHPSSNATEAPPPHPDHALHEIKRLHLQVAALQKQLDDAHARNSSIRNNHTLVSTNLQRQLTREQGAAARLRREGAARDGRVAATLERLVREDGAREGRERRQRLASDGARLGRLVSARVAGGLGLGMGPRAALESWEDGSVPAALKGRRGALRGRREGLERRRAELAALAATGRGAAAAGGDDASNSNSNAAEAGTRMDDLEWMEANETVRLHLEEATRQEAELEAEERALTLEKRAHVRALKLVANEDASKFRGRRKLHDRYVLLNLLGRGGFSEVWRAFDLHDLRHVAVKIHQLEPSWSDAKKENYTKHVSREYEIHREVRHPRIVSLHDVFEIDTDSFATVLECCAGSDLDTRLKDRGRLAERDARATLLQVLAGMRYLSAPSADGRRQGIIHYDLKPGNILFDEAGNAKITDFGLSKIVDTAQDGGDSMELTSQGAGTYWYLPPECFLMDQDVRISNKVDVWSIGVIYFQMLFGRRPFGDGQSQDHILRNQTMLHATEVNFPATPVITEEGKAFIRDCLTYDQMSRPNMSQICQHGYLELKTL